MNSELTTEAVNTRLGTTMHNTFSLFPAMVIPIRKILVACSSNSEHLYHTVKTYPIKPPFMYDVHKLII